jgi:phytanoyl-CoA hydroxylase
MKLHPAVTFVKDISYGQKRGGLAVEEGTITKIQNFEEVPSLYEYCLEDAILTNVKTLIGKDIYSIHTMFINKPTDLGTGSSRHPPHQDVLYFPYTPEARMCAAWTALEPINIANGCLYVYPGSHILPLQPHTYPTDGIVNQAYLGIHSIPAEFQSVNVEMETGDTIYFHPLLIHGSGPNLTPRFRKAISCHYTASDVHLIEMSRSNQHELIAEIEDMFLKKRGFVAKYSDLFRFKSKHISGAKSSAIELPKSWRALFFARIYLMDKLKRLQRKFR